MADSESEDEYMKMTFEDPPKSKYETSLQRAARERREREDRSRQKTKAEREAEAEMKREEALSTPMDTNNKGFKMMAKLGFKQGDALGKTENARKVPIGIDIKGDKGGIGLESERKRKFREQADEMQREAKKSKGDILDYREAQRQMMAEKKLNKDLENAQKTAENLYETATDPEGKELGKKPLKSINVLWRGLSKGRLEELRHKQQQKHFQNSLLKSRLTQEEDEEDDLAFGPGSAFNRGSAFTRRGSGFARVADELEDEDPELAEFEAQPLEDRLNRVIIFLRDNYNYCYWCGHRYPDEDMDGCPGENEMDHE